MSVIVVNQEGKNLKRSYLDKRHIVKKIKDTLEPLDYIVFAYLFGSYATDTEWAKSDIDIAVYINEKKSKEFL